MWAFKLYSWELDSAYKKQQEKKIQVRNGFDSKQKVILPNQIYLTEQQKKL